MRDIVIIDHFSQTPDEKGNNRFIYLADMLCDLGANVEIITSFFSHKTKTKRKLPDELFKSLKYKYTMLYEPEYNKNVSLKRFYSHYIFGKSLKKYLENRKKPDAILCAVPSLDAGFEAAKYCKINGIPFIPDIQDIWPEAFKLILKAPLISDLIFLPFTLKSKYIYKNATQLAAVSQTYLDVGLKANDKLKTGTVVFLGTDLEKFDEAANTRAQKNRKEFWVTYIGTLGHSYNINVISDALAILRDKGMDNIVFKVLGDGPLMESFMAYAKSKNIACDFLGRLHYNEMIGILASSDIAVNPIISGAAQSIINKVGDYAAAGLAVVSTQECPEYRELLEKYHCGFNCKPDDALDVADKILLLYNDENLKNTMGKNNRWCAEELFDRRKTYQKLCDLVMKDG